MLAMRKSKCKEISMRNVRVRAAGRNTKSAKKNNRHYGLYYVSDYNPAAQSMLVYYLDSNDMLVATTIELRDTDHFRRIVDAYWGCSSIDQLSSHFVPTFIRCCVRRNRHRTEKPPLLPVLPDRATKLANAVLDGIYYNTAGNVDALRIRTES
jgi:hypothetical protein